jgi:hypothetical protein
MGKFCGLHEFEGEVECKRRAAVGESATIGSILKQGASQRLRGDGFDGSRDLLTMDRQVMLAIYPGFISMNIASLLEGFIGERGATAISISTRFLIVCTCSAVHFSIHCPVGFDLSRTQTISKIHGNTTGKSTNRPGDCAASNMEVSIARHQNEGCSCQIPGDF